MLVLKLILLSLMSCLSTDLRVLFFTMDSCPPCRQTEPAVDRLAQDGVAVSKVDVRQQSQYADQCQIRSTPTIIIADGNQVVARHSGVMSYGDLQGMLRQAKQRVAASAPPSTNPAETAATMSQSRTAPRSQPPTRRVYNASRSSSNANARSESATQQHSPQQLAHRATVRFRVEDAEGTSFATGTIIHKVNNEALVLTCGHVFRDSDGQGKINADLGFYQDQPTTVVGKLLFYDAKQHDIALVAIPCPLDIEPVPVAPEALAVQTGDKIFSLGCDRGTTPSVRDSVLKAVTRYSGVVKFDIVGRPVDGRSGGGLFSAGGQLIGVCNAAAIDVDEGIYTGLQSIYWQFAKSNLTHLFKRDAVRAQLTFNDANRQQRPVAQRANAVQATTANQYAATNQRQPSNNRLAHPSRRSSMPNAVQASPVNARGDELTPPVNTAIYRGGGVPTNNAIYRGTEMPVRLASAPANSGRRTNGNDSEFEVIVLVRSKQDPSQMETITIKNPDQDTVRWLNSQRSGSQAGRMADMPDLKRPENRAAKAQMRAQSPR